MRFGKAPAWYQLLGMGPVMFGLLARPRYLRCGMLCAHCAGSCPEVPEDPMAKEVRKGPRLRPQERCSVPGHKCWHQWSRHLWTHDTPLLAAQPGNVTQARLGVLRAARCLQNATDAAGMR